MESQFQPINSSSRSSPAEDHHNQRPDESQQDKNNSESMADVDGQPPPLTTDPICSYQNFSLPSKAATNLLKTGHPFQAQGTDILFVSKPKSGTTWLKALIFTIINREKYPVEVNGCHPVKPQTADRHHHPLLTANPHDLVPSLEFQFLESTTLLDEFSRLPPPRFYSTHLPYPILPESVRTSGCKIIYLCRNPLDTLVSWWCFGARKGETDEESLKRLEEVVDSFCGGVEAFGPHWDHVLGYWNESLENSDKVLFMRFEEMKLDPLPGIRKMAEFLGYPFTQQEEEDGLIEGIAELCSFRSLKDLEGNRSAEDASNRKFFRKGKVGDWVNHLTPSMAERVKIVMQQKFKGTGLDMDQN